MTFFQLSAVLVFWLSLAALLYTYLFYPLLLSIGYTAIELRSAWRRMLRDPLGPRLAPSRFEPSVSIVVAAHNEANTLPHLVQSLRDCEYAEGKVELIVVSDGSDDGTAEWLCRCPEDWIHSVILPRQGGKANALNHGVARATHDLLVFTDASTRFLPHTLGMLMRHFRHERTGVVCGLLRFVHNRNSAGTEGVYWGYECLLRLMEDRLGATLTASGALYALRRNCFPGLKPTTLIEDFVVPMHARRLGYKVRYDPEAVAFEYPAESLRGEFARRTRLAMGSFRAMGTLLRTPLDGVTRWALISHKLMRWLAPFFLIFMLLASLALWRDPLYRVLAIGQVAVYGWAVVGGRGWLPGARLARVMYFFLAMNLAFFWGMLRALRRREETSWQRAA